MTTIDHLSWAHPLLKEWFIHHFGSPTEPQIQGWPSILEEKATLISAPTGSGKTLAAFLTCIDQLVRKALDGRLSDQTEVIYVSPLKALSNDIQKNLMHPLHGITELAKKNHLPMQDIRVAVRTGDTLATERQAMLKNPPHILVTTPESFYILLTAEKSRAMLKNVKTIIVDEIHAMVNDKRGTHLSLSIERLEALTSKPLIRIGLSATQKPISKVGNFLTGNNRALPTIVNIDHLRKLDLAMEIPESELTAVASNEMWDEIYNRLAELSKTNQSTLVFVNTRRLAERVAHHLSERLGEKNVAAHHGSLSRKLRLQAETQLKNGELKVLVATASLELGIDIGAIDLVCQIGSPKSISATLQRIGRAGHQVNSTSKGRIFATTRDELIECAALIKAIKDRELDELIIPNEPLDILCQQIVATCATSDWKEEDLFNLVKKAFPYRNLKKETFHSLITILSEGIAGARTRYGAYLFYDQINGIVKGRKGARLTAITNGGAIPENGLFTVVVEPNEIVIGTLDEDFAVESNRGDIILLGTTSWRVNRVESAKGRVMVEDAKGAPPSVPFWRGEAPGRTEELSAQVSDIREKINELLTPIASDETRKIAMNWLKKYCGMEEKASQQLIEYILQGRAVLGSVPSKKNIIAERFFDESGGMQLIIHAPFGSRINKAWGLALRKCFCRSFNFELQASATEDGLNISLLEQHSFPLEDVFKFLHPNTLEKVLTQAVLQSPLFNTRWRWDATRALALKRFRNGKKVPPNIQRMLADDLLAAVFPDAAACQDNLAGQDIELPTHPLIDETMKDVFTEALDLEGLMQVLKKINNGTIQYQAIDTPMPSVFAHEILNANPYAFLDDAPLEERRARAVEMRRVLPLAVLTNIGKLNPDAIKEVQDQAWPDIRNADELHDSLQSFVGFPFDFNLQDRQAASIWWNFFEELEKEGRVGEVLVQKKLFWVTAEKASIFLMIYPGAVFRHTLKKIETSIENNEEALVKMLQGWLSHLGPITAKELAVTLSIEEREIEKALLKLETSGLILRGQFRNFEENSIEWCERRLLARIHRLTLDRLRKEIEPVSEERFFNWLQKWQHIAPNTQLIGEQGLLEIIRQMQGVEMPANAWEKDIFSKRITNYDRDFLDHLCLSGAVGWGRLSHLGIPQDKPKRVRPTRISPITFFIREESNWMTKKENPMEDKTILFSPAAKKIYLFLKERGASFFTDIVKNVPHLKSEIENALWELIAAGVITADSFDSLRALIDPKRRQDKRRRRVQVRFGSGRWSLLYIDEVGDKAEQIKAACWMLLKRYGVVYRDLVIKEKNIPRWRDLLLTFRRLEDQGEIRGGRFVSGVAGEQFALPYAVESLRG